MAEPTISEHARDIAELKTSIALIQKDIASFNKSISNIEESLKNIGSIDRALVAQQSVLESYERRLNFVEQEFNEYSRHIRDIQTDMISQSERIRAEIRIETNKNAEEFRSEIREITKEFRAQAEAHTSRTGKLENWRYLIMGMLVVASFFLGGWTIPIF